MTNAALEYLEPPGKALDQTTPNEQWSRTK